METVATGMAGPWRSHRIAKQNKPPSRSHVYHLYWQGGSRSPQWPSVSKKKQTSAKCWSYGQSIVSGKQTSCTRDMNSIIARRNSQNQSTLTSLRLERSPKLASLEPCKMTSSAVESLVVSVIMAYEENYFKNLDYCCRDVLTSVWRMRLPRHSSKTWHRAKLPNTIEANAVTQKESSKKLKTPKENGKDPKDQLSTECKYCGNNPGGGRKTNVLHTEKRALDVEKPTILRQSVVRIHANLRSSVPDVQRVESEPVRWQHRVLLFFRRRDLVCVFHPHGNYKWVGERQVVSGASCNGLPRKFLPRNT